MAGKHDWISSKKRRVSPGTMGIPLIADSLAQISLIQRPFKKFGKSWLTLKINLEKIGKSTAQMSHSRGFPHLSCTPDQQRFMPGVLLPCDEMPVNISRKISHE